MSDEETIKKIENRVENHAEKIGDHGTRIHNLEITTHELVVLNRGVEKGVERISKSVDHLGDRFEASQREMAKDMTVLANNVSKNMLDQARDQRKSQATIFSLGIAGLTMIAAVVGSLFHFFG